MRLPHSKLGQLKGAPYENEFTSIFIEVLNFLTTKAGYLDILKEYLLNNFPLS